MNTEQQEGVAPEQTTEPSPEKQGKKGGELKVRVISATVYVIVLLAFFAMKIFVWVPYEKNASGALHIGTLLFDVLIVAFAAVGTFEMLRAFREKIYKPMRVVVMVFALATLVTYCACDFIFVEVLGVSLPDPGLEGIATVPGRNYSMYITLGVLMTGVAVLFSFLVFAHADVTLESTGYSLMCFLYPTFFLVILSVCNHLEIYSELAILLVFVVCPCADSLAFFFGKAFGKKLPAKMAPTISPKKTVIGGIGGLLGGAIGAVLIYFACYGLTFLDDLGIIAPLRWELSINSLEILFFIGLGVLTSAFSQFGDLVESAVKRKLGVKDMGKIMPGHGGILDRIDSALYAGLIVALCMVARIMIVG